MAHLELRRGSRGSEVEALQCLLNRIGAMLVPDKDFGPGTERAVRFAQTCANLPVNGVIDTSLRSWLDQQPEPFPYLPTDGLAWIAREETGGLQYYEMHTRFPHFPGGQSGITIGIGYDLRMNALADFHATWKGLLPQPALCELERDIGKPGSQRRCHELRDRNVEVPFQAAWPVFVHASVPRYYALTRSAFPSLDSLPGDCRTVLVSLVFNRGTSCRGRNREEMAAIQRLLAEAAQPDLPLPARRDLLAAVEDQLILMKRLWPPTSGLVKRRQEEANRWRRGLDYL